MLKIGLTGGIGSGKTTVIKFLSELGAPVIDADKVGHAVYEPDGPAYEEVIAAFGRRIVGPDNKIDRSKLGPIVFGNPTALAKLTGIVWPKISQRIKEMITEMRARGERKPIIVEAAILIEAGWQPLFDEIWLICASKDRVIERVEKERGLKPEQTEARIRAQLPDEERRKYATLTIENNGTIDQLKQRIGEIWAEALKRNAA
jgi:dephospho-CoA kinase